MPEITSRQHPVVRAFKSAAAGEGELALLDGPHLLQEAIRAQVDLAVVAISSHDVVDPALLDRLAPPCDVVRVTPAVMDAISPVRTPSGVVALARRRSHSLPSLWARTPALVLAAVDVQDPGNAGAILRAGEAAGVSGVLFAGASADPWGWKALRAAMGSTFRLPAVRARDLKAACHELRDAGLIIAATVPRCGTPMHAFDLTRATVLLLGAEGTGLDAATLAMASERVSIPMTPPVESLNVAVAAGLLAYEARRQRDLA